MAASVATGQAFTMAKLFGSVPQKKPDLQEEFPSTDSQVATVAFYIHSRPRYRKGNHLDRWDDAETELLPILPSPKVKA